MTTRRIGKQSRTREGARFPSRRGFRRRPSASLDPARRGGFRRLRTSSASTRPTSRRARSRSRGGMLVRRSIARARDRSGRRARREARARRRKKPKPDFPFRENARAWRDARILPRPRAIFVPTNANLSGSLACEIAVMKKECASFLLKIASSFFRKLQTESVSHDRSFEEARKARDIISESIDRGRGGSECVARS